MRRLRVTVLAVGGSWWLAAAEAQEAEPAPAPDLDFLEYLGTWAEEDDEWLAIEEWQKDNGDAADEGAPKAPKPERKDDDESE
jgi:hypothetical protein